MQTEADLHQMRLFAVRLPADLYKALERDAAQLGVSLADVGRIRLRTGRVPSIKEGSAMSDNNTSRRGSRAA
jgi:hypothetical protein